MRVLWKVTITWPNGPTTDYTEAVSALAAQKNVLDHCERSARESGEGDEGIGHYRAIAAEHVGNLIWGEGNT